MFILKTVFVCQSQIIEFTASFDLIKFELFFCTYNVFSGGCKEKVACQSLPVFI